MSSAWCNHLWLSTTATDYSVTSTFSLRFVCVFCFWIITAAGVCVRVCLQYVSAFSLEKIISVWMSLLLNIVNHKLTVYVFLCVAVKSRAKHDWTSANYKNSCNHTFSWADRPTEWPIELLLKNKRHSNVALNSLLGRMNTFLIVVNIVFWKPDILYTYIQSTHTLLCLQGPH